MQSGVHEELLWPWLLIGTHRLAQEFPPLQCHLMPYIRSSIACQFPHQPLLSPYSLAVPLITLTPVHAVPACTTWPQPSSFPNSSLPSESTVWSKLNMLHKHTNKQAEDHVVEKTATTMDLIDDQSCILLTSQRSLYSSQLGAGSHMVHTTLSLWWVWACCRWPAIRRF